MLTTPRLLVFSLFLLAGSPAYATQSPAPAVLDPGPRPAMPAGSNDEALYLEALNAHWHVSAQGDDYREIAAAVDRIVAPDGSLRVPPEQALPIGRAILLAYRVTQKPSYYRAAHQLRNSLQASGDKAGFQLAPFLAGYGITFQDRGALDQAAALLLRIDSTARDLGTGLFFTQGGRIPPASALPPNVDVLRAIVDTLDAVPLGYPQRGELVEALNKSVAGLQAQEREAKVWETLPADARKVLFLYAYAVARGVRLDYLPESDMAFAEQAWSEARKGSTDAKTPEYVLASTEMGQSASQSLGQGKTVMMDGWFNSQRRTNAAGGAELFHYKWNDDADSGFSFFGAAFARYGAQLDVLPSAPTAAKLAAAQVYLIVSPDTPAKNPQPHFMEKASGDAIEAWVRGGGVLVLMMNDGANTEFEHLNTLSERFGMRFNPVDNRPVQGSHWEQGIVKIPADGTIFKQVHQAYMKDICTITLSGVATPVLAEGKDVFMAVTTFGRGTVFAVTDPWLYNEYTDGRKLPPAYDNFAAGTELAEWLLRQTP